MAHMLHSHQVSGDPDFPITCQSCLCDNPYLRMTKAHYGKECKTCTRPFRVFRWRPGRDARYKKTEICQTCARLKNVCQVCVLDLKYGLPVQARDSALGVGLGDGANAIPMARSDVNRAYFAEEQDRRAGVGLDHDSSASSSYGKLRVGLNDTILKLQRTTPYYKRNRAHPCSFYIRGECRRGAECPYRHEMPAQTGGLAQQNIKDRYDGVNDPVGLMLLRKAREMLSPSTPPAEDEIRRTLYVGGFDKKINQIDIGDSFHAYGEIESIRLVPQQACAFVTYTTREGAEKAVKSLANKLVIKGSTLNFKWVRLEEEVVPKSQFGSGDPYDSAKQTIGSIIHGHMLPPSIGSQYQNATDERALYNNYFTPSLPTSQPFYPSMDPRRMGFIEATQADHEMSISGPSGNRN